MKTRFWISVLALLATSAAGYAQPQSPSPAPAVPSSGAAWTDRSPHRSAFVTANGVKLHYLDWGGTGDPMLLLTGLSDSAHVYDDFAPRFTDRFRVLALTRRGHGDSERTQSGFDPATLVEDVRAFLDAMGIERTILVGHSIGGDELTLFAGTFPARVSKLVYLDAAHDHSPALLSFIGPLIRLSNFPARDNESLDATRNWQKKFLHTWSDAAEAALRTKWSRKEDGTIQTFAPGRILGAISRQVIPPDYSKVKAPALCFEADDFYPLLLAAAEPEKVEPLLAAQRKYYDSERNKVRAGMPQAKIIIMPDTSHYCFIQREAQVVREMRAFLLNDK